ncbi:glycerol-3-phosphate dehydrogenase [Marinobacteraceae bacterium S3BR75-40.1]
MPTLSSTTFDLFIVGGGINGTGIAADAAGRGLSVGLCEQGDLAGATSSASSKLIHGGLRYLEHKEFRLVKEALAERETLLRAAPHLVQPLRFTLPHLKHLRPAWMLRTGLFMYDHLSKRVSLPGSKSVKFGPNSPLKPEIRKGFMYSDCWVDDARLVILNAVAARRKGADIRTRTRCIGARRLSDRQVWEIKLENVLDHSVETLYAKAMVNAAGPWAERLFDEALTEPSSRHLRLIKGSHIVVPKFHDWPGAFILQNNDGRIVFVLPFQDDYNLIGTTDKAYEGDPQSVKIDDEEIDYLLDVVNNHFVKRLERKDIVATYSGVRALCDDESTDPSAMTRDYTLDLSAPQEQTPLLSVFGGKITTYRKLAEAALARLAPWFSQMGPSWTHTMTLPGASQHTPDLAALRELLEELYPAFPERLLNRYARAYGTLAIRFLGNAQTPEDLGHDFGHGLYQREVDYLVREEWAHTAEDILWRRTKLSLRFTAEEKDALETYLATQRLPGLANNAQRELREA